MPLYLKCNKGNCGTCAYILETDIVYLKNFFTNEVAHFKLLKPFSCTSRNVIYKITCNECSQFYIGETVHLRNRVTQHKSSLRYEYNRVMKVHKHLHECANNHPIPFNIVPFYYVTQGTLTARLTIENYFFRKYKPTLNGF